MSKPFRAACAVMTLLFLLCVAVQYNDPDPLVWMAMYGAAAGCSVGAFRGRLDWRVPAALTLATLVWALWLLPGVIGHTSIDEMTASYRMGANPAAEEGRESGGLFIVAAWSLFLAVRFRRRAVASRGIEPDGLEQIRVG